MVLPFDVLLVSGCLVSGGVCCLGSGSRAVQKWHFISTLKMFYSVLLYYMIAASALLWVDQIRLTLSYFKLIFLWLLLQMRIRSFICTNPDPLILPKLAHDWYIGSVGSHTPGTRPIFLPIGGSLSHQIRIRRISYNNPDLTLPTKILAHDWYIGILGSRNTLGTRPILFTYRGLLQPSNTDPAHNI